MVFNDTSYEQVNKYCHAWWMSPSIGQQSTFSYQQLCDEILSWMIEIWMKNHLVSDNICNTINS